MSMIAALILAQSANVIGTVPKPNAELDAANACLVAGVEKQLANKRPEPDAKERWEWALKTVDGCQPEITAAARSDGAVPVVGEGSGQNISKGSALRTEAIYYVDRLLREHFERAAK